MNHRADQVGRLELIVRGLALGALLLTAVTWRLWIPQNLFPRVPLFEVLATLPAVVVALANWLALVSCCSALVCLLAFKLKPPLARAAVVIACASFLALSALDQHRLQPWGVHIGVSLLLITCARYARRLDYLIWFTASIYVYSAFGKLDAQFIHTVGQDFVRSLLGLLGRDADQVAYRTRVALAIAFPLVELAIGMGMLFRRTRSVAAVAAVVMHLGLLLVLGPFGLKHAWGVLVWNALFAGLNVALFLWPSRVQRLAAEPTLAEADPSNASGQRWRFGLGEGLLMVAVILPAGERLGLVDHWLGWALYAPHSSRVRIEIASVAREKLPACVQPFVVVPEDANSLWSEARIDRWSLAKLAAPVTPQARFQLGVARALAQCVNEHELRVEVLGTADRWTGRRQSHELRSSAELNAESKKYWFNTTPVFDPPPQ